MRSIDALAARRALLRPFVLFFLAMLSWFVAPNALADCDTRYIAAGAYPASPQCPLKAAAADFGGMGGYVCGDPNVIAAYCSGPAGTDSTEPVSMEGGMPDNGDNCSDDSTAGCGNSTSGAEPVNLYTGQFYFFAHDLAVADTIALDLARVYRSGAYDNAGKPLVGAFGVGGGLTFDTILAMSRDRQRFELRQATGIRVPFTPRAGSNGNGWDDLTSPGEYYRARIDAAGSTGMTLSLRDGRVQRFTSIGGVYRLSRIEDRNGNALVIARDSKTGAITSVSGPNGRTLTFTSIVGARGTPLISRVTDPLNRQVSYQYDNQDRLTQVTDAGGGIWKYGWDSKSRLVTVTDPEGNLQVTSTYDDSDRVVAQKLADGSTFAIAYTMTGGKVTQTEVTDRRGSIRRLEFDANGRVVRNTYPAGQPAQQVQTFAYDATGRVTNLTSTDRQYTYTYDANGNRTSGSDQYGTLHTRTYDSYSQVLTDAEAGDPQRGVATVYTYDAKGNLLTVTDRLGNRTTQTNDSQGRPLTVTDALRGVTRYTYTGADLTGITDPLNRTTQYTADAAGRVTAVQDPLGNKTKRTLGGLDRTTDITDALGGVTRFTWDRNGRLLSQGDPKGVTTRYAYNTIGRPVSKTDALGRSETYTWTPAGQLQSVTDRKGQVTGYTYDEAGRLEGTAFQPAAGVVSTRRWSYMWDDTLNRIGGVDDYARAEPGGAERRTTSTLFYYDSVTGKFVRTLEWPRQSGSWSYRYNAATRELDGIDMFGVTVTYSRDAEHRVTQIQSVENDEAPRRFGYGYDVLGRLAQATLANGITANYTWDAASQLTGITYKRSDGSVLGDLTYGYDLAGRRTKMGGSLAKVDLPQPVSDPQYNGANQLTRWLGKTLTYDPNGNLTGDGLNQYSWNLQGLLGGITGPTTAAFSYDASGRRRNMTVDGQQTRMVWVDDELNLLLPDDDWSKRTRLFSPYPAGGLDELTYRRIGDDASQDRYVLRDGNNNVIALTDANQHIVTQYRYEPYGKTTLAGAADANTQQYTGRENDGTGLYYYRNRYYSPSTARFISEDPIGWESGQTNAYAYVGGNPVQLNDPFGLGSTGTPGNNQAQNKQVSDIVRELGLTKGQRRKLHDAITGQDYGYHEIKAIAIDMFCPTNN
ncbi:DUF6531 domain-containing protein [Paraburkholderia madseniana]|uniref:RHS repeat-associated core domain-containing protein n=1 Tax=Paraburkholderia madseniana TaxID=2599607 RepID=UPI0038BB8B40